MSYRADDIVYTILWKGGPEKQPDVWANLATETAEHLEWPDPINKRFLTDEQIVGSMIVVHFTRGNVELACALMEATAKSIRRFCGHIQKIKGGDLFDWIVTQWMDNPVPGVEYFPDFADVQRAGKRSTALLEMRKMRMPR